MSRTKQIRERRDARIRANIQAHLGPDFQPLPDTNRVFIALNRIKDQVEQAEAWQRAVQAGDTSPDALQVHGEVHKVHKVGAQVHAEVHTQETQVHAEVHKIGAQVHAEDTPLGNPAPKDTGAPIAVTRLEKLGNAVAVLKNLDEVHQFAMDSYDLQTVGLYHSLLESLVKLNAMWRADRTVKWKALAEKQMKELEQ